MWTLVNTRVANTIHTPMSTNISSITPSPNMHHFHHMPWCATAMRPRTTRSTRTCLCTRCQQFQSMRLHRHPFLATSISLPTRWQCSADRRLRRQPSCSIHWWCWTCLCLVTRVLRSTLRLYHQQQQKHQCHIRRFRLLCSTRWSSTLAWQAINCNRSFCCNSSLNLAIWTRSLTSRATASSAATTTTTSALSLVSIMKRARKKKKKKKKREKKRTWMKRTRRMWRQKIETVIWTEKLVCPCPMRTHLNTTLTTTPTIITSIAVTSTRMIKKTG